MAPLTEGGTRADGDLIEKMLESLMASNPGHAINLAKKLNVLFKTDKFTVVLLKQGDQIYP
jgi:hypothetical protein